MISKTYSNRNKENRWIGIKLEKVVAVLSWNRKIYNGVIGLVDSEVIVRW